ncbi:MAG: DNA polymerase III subunit delta [Alphaproteobacteria bacterium]|nr:DNA polymerase III subunit delta [Alphaproteobacteria bacterium]
MQLKPREAEAFLASPDPAIRAVLLFGPDAGQARERADHLTRLVAGGLDDPFRVAPLRREALLESPARLHDEAAALSLIGGRRVLRLALTDVGKALATLLADYVAAPAPGDSLVLVEAGDLAREDALRQAFEAAANAVALPCYADEGEALARFARRTLGEQRVAAEDAAIDYLLQHVGGDRALVRAELDKLALYAGRDGRLALADVEALISDALEQDLQALAFAVADGALAAVDRDYQRCLRSGTSPVGVARAVLRHFQRLHGYAVQLEPGGDPQRLFERLRPKPFWKQLPALRRQLQAWSAGRLAEAMRRLDEAEAGCKQTDMPAAALVGQTLLTVALAGRGRPGRWAQPPPMPAQSRRKSSGHLEEPHH